MKMNRGESVKGKRKRKRKEDTDKDDKQRMPVKKGSIFQITISNRNPVPRDKTTA